MKENITTDDIHIRTDLKAGDIGYITWLHGVLYKEEFNYSIYFESYVAKGLSEFYEQYDPAKDRVWICEHDNRIIGFLLLMHKGNATAQLRFFYFRNSIQGHRSWKKADEIAKGFSA